jgi:EmrB/QacA subfamily drug resistance transporter
MKQRDKYDAQLPNSSILIIVACAMFMESVDTTIINTAIPVMAKHFQVNPIDLKLALISYLLSLSIFIPISGWLGDKFGVKKMFLYALIVFTAGSMWCGLTNSLWQLVIARMVQGLGGSLTLPLGRLIIIRSYPREQLISKMSIVVMVASIGLMLGPLMGGLITQYMSWRWIFWVNVPVGLLSFTTALRLLPTMPPQDVHSLDRYGFILFGTGLSMLTLGLSTLSESSIQHRTSLIFIASAVILLCFYRWHSRNRLHPIIKTDLFQIRTFRIAIMMNLVSRMGFGGIPFLLPLLLQISLSYSPEEAGLLLAPIALGVLTAKPISFRVLQTLGYKRLLSINTLLVGLTLWSFAWIQTDSSIYHIACLTFIYGFLIALQYTAMNSLAYANIDPHDISAATSIMSTIQQIAQSFGVAITAIILQANAYNLSTSSFFNLQIFHRTFFIMGICTGLSTLILTKMHAEDGLELIHTKRNPD